MMRLLAFFLFWGFTLNLTGQTDSIYNLDYFPHFLLEWDKDESIDRISNNTQLKETASENNITNTYNKRESELHAAVNPTNPSNKIIVYRYKDSLNQTISSLYYTDNNGETWNPPSTFSPYPSESYGIMGPGGDPVVVFDQSGKAYFTWMLTYTKVGDSTFNLGDTITHVIHWAESTDGGANWVRHPVDYITKGTAVLYPSSISVLSGQFTDKEWIATVPNGVNESDLAAIYFNIPVPDPSLSSLNYRLKKSANNYFNTSDINITEPLLNAVINNGISYQQFPSLCINQSNDILVAFNGTDFSTIGSPTEGFYFSKSMDNGESFSPLTKISDFTQFEMSTDSAYLSSNNLRRIASNTQIAVDNSSTSPFENNIYVVWNAIGINNNEGNGIDIYMAKSEDAGTTWSTPTRVNNDPTGLNVAQYLPSIYLTENGTIVIGYYDRRNYHDLSTDYYFSVSSDGGSSFSDFQVTTVPSNFSDTLVGGFSVGDYVQILADDDYIYPIWVDGRSNDENLDIYFGKIDMDNPTSVESINILDGSLSIGFPFPNPTTSFFEIKGDFDKMKNYNVRVFNALGRLQYHKLISKSSDKFIGDISSLTSGEYFIVIYENNKMKYGRRIVKI